MSLTVVIPSRALTGLLRQCLSSLEDAAAFAAIEGLQVVVVDNATPVPYRRAELTTDLDLKLLRFDTPRSFSRACNAGARVGDEAAPLLFLNNDVLLHRRALVDLFATAQSYRATVSGARLVYPDDTIQHCGVLFDSGDRG
ncbi:MAG: glycosyltransferase family 2 protein, partial [Actinomycetota bacterium]